MRYNFEWDVIKAKFNIGKHKVSFEQAAEIFKDPFAVSIFDEKHAQEEDRWVTIGKSGSEVILVVIHTFRQESISQCNVRIISARKAVKKEVFQYEER